MSGEYSTPRVLLADDHQDMLTLASSTLKQTCNVVAAVTDGAQAVEQALRLNPDVVVLDITMPVLDGYQAARELRRRGSQAKVVFLSLHEGDEFVSAAFESGGQAFVSKHRMWVDLPGAVRHVCSGRIFLPSLSSLSAVAPRGGHAVMFYSHHNSWCDEAAGLVKSRSLAEIRSSSSRRKSRARVSRRGWPRAVWIRCGHRRTVDTPSQTLSRRSSRSPTTGGPIGGA